HEVPLIFNPRQRPLIQYSKLPAPYHQQPWFFSLTHTRGMAAWTLAQNPVGIDLEDDSPRLNVRDYARDYCSQPEWLKLAFIEEERDFVDLFRKIWVMKEAHFKMGVTESSDSFQKTAFTFHEDRVWCEWLGPERFGGSCYLMNPSPQYLLGLVCLTGEKLEPIIIKA
ncbi:4'-phosphopantetheinyl transferase superfamily protein, partial [bacterium]|nr:4'-phosphopantetheinyl transferase superfamily protein [bacterium]